MNTGMKRISRFVLALFVLSQGSACSKGGSSYSLLPDSNSFQQSSTVSLQKIDILWVVDNSGSMNPIQKNLVNNFQSFIQEFISKERDFHIAVTTTDAYLALPGFLSDSSMSRFRDGLGANTTGYPIIDSSTPNIVNTFMINASQGDKGDGDERAFSSMKAALLNPANAAFKRPDSFLAVIIVSDEDDFSDPNRPEGSWVKPGGIPDHDYTNPGLESVDSYVAFLDQYTNSTSPAARQFNVSSVAVLDNTCLKAHKPASPSSIIGQRYIEMAQKTNGVLGDICSPSYASAFINIQKKIIELSTQFYLNRTPNVSSLRVVVNGQVVPQDLANGWSYNSSSNSIIFHGSAVPSDGASITVSFDPAGITL